MQKQNSSINRDLCAKEKLKLFLESKKCIKHQKSQSIDKPQSNMHDKYRDRFQFQAFLHSKLEHNMNKQLFMTS